MDWIKCSDRMPEEDEWIIIGSSIYANVTFGMLIGGKFFNPDLNYFLIEGVTHWMLLPSAPLTSVEGL